MASSFLSHLSLASNHRASIAFFCLIVTIFVIPFFSLSTTSALIPSVNTLPTIVYSLWVSPLYILTSSPFYFLLLNFLIVALVFLSGVLDPSSMGNEFDGIQEQDVHRRGPHSYPTAAQSVQEGLVFDELHESQVSFLPYLSIIESSLTYVAGEVAFGNSYGIDDKAGIDKGKQIVANPTDSCLREKPSDSTEEGSGSGSGRKDATKGSDSLSTSGMGRGDLDTEKTFPVSCVILETEIAQPYGVCKDNQAESILVCDSKNLHPEAEGNVDVEAPMAEHTADAINTKNDVSRSITQRHRHRLARMPSEPAIAGHIHPQHTEAAVGAGVGRCMSLERVEWLDVDVEKQKKAGEEMSREELNERASAFITAFRKKLVSTPMDDTSGQM